MTDKTHLITWPEVIWLTPGCDPLPTFKECSEVSWCSDQIGNSDVRYSRQDVADARIAELEANLIERVQEVLDVNAKLVATQEKSDRLQGELDRLKSDVSWTKYPDRMGS